MMMSLHAESHIKGGQANANHYRSTTVARPPSDFASQFVIGPKDGLGHASSATQRPDGRLELDSLELAWFAPCRVIRVFDGGGDLIGALIGHPVDCSAGCVISGEMRTADRVAEVGAERFVEDNIYTLAGSFLFVLDCPQGQRVYLDADGTLSAVWDPEQRRVAATAGLLADPAGYAARFDARLYRRLDILHDGWFPGGLTAHRGIHRILVNHYLDLTDWTQHRHWPTAPIAESGDPAAACRRIGHTTRRIINALRREGPVTLTLTAGNETRLLLACCRDIAGELSFATVSGPQTHLDALRARELAVHFGLRHRLLPVRHASQAEQAEWHARTGHCNGGGNMQSHPSVSALSDQAYFVTGLGGEIGRGFFWRPDDCGDTRLTADHLVRRMGLPHDDCVQQAISAWLPGVAQFDTYLQLDLAYLELRMGCWAFAQSYATPQVRRISPMICRSVYADMLSLPPSWRRGNRLILDTIRQLWPELLEFPINRYGDYRDTTRRLGSAIGNPRLVMRRLRKSLA